MSDDYKNFAYTTVTVAPSTPTGGLTMTVASGTVLPAVPFNATVRGAGATEAVIATTSEIVRVTANAAGVLTILRAQEGTSARTIVAGDILDAGPTVRTLTDILKRGTYVNSGNYPGSNTDTVFQATLGTAASPTTSQDAVAIYQKTSGVTGAVGNPAVYFSHIKKGVGAGSQAATLFVETIDLVSSATSSFIEGGRFHAFGSGGTGASMYGVNATVAGPSYQYLVSFEGDIYQNSGADSPLASSFDVNTFAASFLSSSSGARKTDVGFLTNPFNAKVHRTGFMVSENSVDGTAFACRAALQYGIDLYVASGKGAYSLGAIRLPNNSAFVARNAAALADVELFRLDTSNNISIPTRVTPRVTSVVTTATATPNADTTDEYAITALDTSVFFANPMGTPTDGDQLAVRVKDDGGGAQGVSWDSGYRGPLLPSTTQGFGAVFYCIFYWNDDDGFWDLVVFTDSII